MVGVEQRLAVAHHRAKAAVQRQQRIDVLLDGAARGLTQRLRDADKGAQVVVDQHFRGDLQDAALARALDGFLLAIAQHAVFVLARFVDRLEVGEASQVIAVVRAVVRQGAGGAEAIPGERLQVVGADQDLVQGVFQQHGEIAGGLHGQHAAGDFFAVHAAGVDAGADQRLLGQAHQRGVGVRVAITRLHGSIAGEHAGAGQQCVDLRAALVVLFRHHVGDLRVEATIERLATCSELGEQPALRGLGGDGVIGQALVLQRGDPGHVAEACKHGADGCGAGRHRGKHGAYGLLGTGCNNRIGSGRDGGRCGRCSGCNSRGGNSRRGGGGSSRSGARLRHDQLALLFHAGVLKLGNDGPLVSLAKRGESSRRGGRLDALTQRGMHCPAGVGDGGDVRQQRGSGDAAVC